MAAIPWDKKMKVFRAKSKYRHVVPQIKENSFYNVYVNK